MMLCFPPAARKLTKTTAGKPARPAALTLDNIKYSGENTLEKTFSGQVAVFVAKKQKK